jgi:uncharacterized membrane protein YhhN
MSVAASVILASAASLGCLVFVILYVRSRSEEGDRFALLWQGLAAVCCPLAGLALLPQGRNSAGVLILLGLVLAMSAQLLRTLSAEKTQGRSRMFLTSAIFSLLGNILQVNAMMSMCQPEWEGVLSMFVVGLVATLYYKKKQAIQPGKLLLPAFIHMFAVLFMACTAVALVVRNPDPGLIFMALGGVGMLVGCNAGLAHRFGKKPGKHLILVARLGFYLAQLLIGWSILLL